MWKTLLVVAGSMLQRLLLGSFFCTRKESYTGEHIKYTLKSTFKYFCQQFQSVSQLAVIGRLTAVIQKPIIGTYGTRVKKGMQLLSVCLSAIQMVSQVLGLNNMLNVNLKIFVQVLFIFSFIYILYFPYIKEKKNLSFGTFWNKKGLMI